MTELNKIIDIIKKLRDPKDGCPWDRKQTHYSLLPYLLEETYELVEAISNGVYFRARREEQIKSSHYFCRVRADEYNYSQNPTYYTGSNAELQNPSFVQDPKSYITTVGYYNNDNELLAVAKLSQPLLKSKDREAVIKVRLDF